MGKLLLPGTQLLFEAGDLALARGQRADQTPYLDVSRRQFMGQTIDFG